VRTLHEPAAGERVDGLATRAANLVVARGLHHEFDRPERDGVTMSDHEAAMPHRPHVFVEVAVNANPLLVRERAPFVGEKVAYNVHVCEGVEESKKCRDRMAAA
jgi:hypothetical protein